MMQIKQLPPGYVSYGIQIRDLSALKDLDHRVRIDPTDHADHHLPKVWFKRDCSQVCKDILFKSKVFAGVREEYIIYHGT